MERLRILIVEDHYLARLAVETVVATQPDLQVVGQAENGQQAIELFESLRPDLVIMDLRLPGIDGVAATRSITRQHPQARILLLSHYETKDDVMRALAAGALGYVRKDVKGPALLNAIRLVAEGHKYLPPSLSSEPADKPQVSLTARETELLQCVFQGLANRDIAQKLGIGEGTVRIHISNILHKLGVKRRTEAVSEALRRGLLRAD